MNDSSQSQVWLPMRLRITEIYQLGLFKASYTWQTLRACLAQSMRVLQKRLSTKQQFLRKAKKIFQNPKGSLILSDKRNWYTDMVEILTRQSLWTSCPSLQIRMKLPCQFCNIKKIIQAGQEAQRYFVCQLKSRKIQARLYLLSRILLPLCKPYLHPMFLKIKMAPSQHANLKQASSAVMKIRFTPLRQL